MGSNSCNNSKKKKKTKRGGTKKKMTVEQSIAYKSVSEWVFLDGNNVCSNGSKRIDIDDDFKVKLVNVKVEKMVFEMHSHSVFSDGFLSPLKLVERAHQHGVCTITFMFFFYCFII